MSTFNKKWSELTKKEKQAAKTTYGEYAKQQWKDAKARTQGFKDAQDRREKRKAAKNATPTEQNNFANPDYYAENAAQAKIRDIKDNAVGDIKKGSGSGKGWKDTVDENTKSELDQAYNTIYGKDNIEDYNFAMGGSGSLKGKEKITKADLKGLQQAGFSDQEIVNHVNRERAGDAFIGGDRAQRFLDKMKRSINTSNIQPAAGSTNTTGSSTTLATNNAANQFSTDNSTNDLHLRLGLSSDPNKSAEDIARTYGNIKRNIRMYGKAPDGRDVYAEAGLKNPHSFNTEWSKDPDAFRKKYGVQRIEEVWSLFKGYDVGATSDKVKEEGWGGASFADGKRPEGMPDYQYAGSMTGQDLGRIQQTLDRGTINLDPGAWGVLGQRVNDEEFKKTFDYSSPAPIISNWNDSGEFAESYERIHGKSLNEANDEILGKENNHYDWTKSHDWHLGRRDHMIDGVAADGREWGKHFQNQRPDNFEYSPGYYHQVAKMGIPGGKPTKWYDSNYQLNPHYEPTKMFDFSYRTV